MTIKYRAILVFPDGERVEDEDMNLCDTLEEAEKEGLQMISDTELGTTEDNFSNVFTDNPIYNPNDIEIEVEEVEVD